MIVVDTNTIAYLWIPGEFTRESEDLYEADPNWVAPYLWKSELRNVLASYLRKGLLSLENSLAIQEGAESQMVDAEYDVTSAQILSLCASSSRSSYDCEFISLAIDLQLPLISWDAALKRSFPDVVITPTAFIDSFS